MENKPELPPHLLFKFSFMMPWDDTRIYMVLAPLSGLYMPAEKVPTEEMIDLLMSTDIICN